MGKALSLCTVCGAPSYNHCKGGEWGGCCRTWTGYTAFDRHRIGPFEPPGLRRCMTDEEMADAGARLTDRGWTFRPPMPSDVLDAWRTE